MHYWGKTSLRNWVIPFFIAIFLSCMTRDSFSSSTRLSFFRSDWASSSANLSCSRTSASLSIESCKSLLTWDKSSFEFGMWLVFFSWRNHQQKIWLTWLTNKKKKILPLSFYFYSALVHRCLCWEISSETAGFEVPFESARVDRVQGSVLVLKREFGLDPIPYSARLVLSLIHISEPTRPY